MPTLLLFDSSVLIPWLRTRHYDELVTTAFASRRFILSTVVWMELYAGTRSRGDKQDLDRIVRAMTGIGRVVSPEPEDFYTVGQVGATYARRYGQMALRDHANDILIALGAWRVRAELVTVNRQDMERWQRLLRRSGKRLTLWAVEAYAPVALELHPMHDSFMIPSLPAVLLSPVSRRCQSPR